MYLYLPLRKENVNRPISKSISSHRAKSGLTWTMKIKATNKDASTEQPSLQTDICSINCFLVAPLTVRKRHSRTSLPKEIHIGIQEIEEGGKQ